MASTQLNFRAIRDLAYLGSLRLNGLRIIENAVHDPDGAVTVGHQSGFTLRGALVAGRLTPLGALLLLPSAIVLARDGISLARDGRNYLRERKKLRSVIRAVR